MRKKIAPHLAYLSAALLILLLVLSAYLNKACPPNKEKSFYLVPYAFLNMLPGNLKNLAADIFLIRGILSSTDEKARSLPYVLGNLRLAAQLNPRLTYAYIIGGIVAPKGKEELIEGTQFLKEGFARQPRDWHLAFWIGFNYLQCGDHLKAAEYYRIASKIPQAPNYLKSLAARSYYEAGSPDIALVYLEGICNSNNDPKLLRNLGIKIEWLRNIVFLEEKAVLFRNKYGYWPDDLEELTRTDFIDKIPADPFGKGYYIEKGNDARYGRVKSRF